MQRIEIRTEIAAPPSRVWRALCLPAEVVRWDGGVVAPIDAPADYPQPGQHVRWRYRSRLFGTLQDRPQEVVEERRLRSLLSFGPVRLDETYDLSPTAEGTALDTTLLVSLPVPAIGTVVERLWLVSWIRSGFEASLSSLRSYCESAGDASSYVI